MFGCLVKIDNDLVKALHVYPISFEEIFKFDNFFYNKFKLEGYTPHCDNKTKNILLYNKQPFEFLNDSILIIPKILVKINKRIKHNYTQIIRKFTFYEKCFVEINRGCTGNCSYCVIKKAKGKLRSRSINDIISDINKACTTSKKLYLVSDDCGCYGLDIGTNLFELLYEIKKRFSDISIELNNLNPNWLEKDPDKYIKLFKDLNIGFVKIPIQSASNKILENMNRHYNVENVISLIDQIKTVSPKTFIFNHFIIGFPGESTFDFLKSLKASKHFDFSFPFKYSKNTGTKSAFLPNQKSKFIILIRYIIFLFNLNFNIAFKLLKSQDYFNN